MWKALLKKQFLELNTFYFRDRRTGKNRGTAGTILFVLLFAAVFLLLASVFYAAADALGTPLLEAGQDWLYFSIMGLLSVLLGILGSVFNTYAGLYRARDNDLLFSMPIPPAAIVTVRLLGVFSMGLLYSGVVWLPAAVWYWLAAAPGPAAVVFALLLLFLNGLLILTLTCLLGWVVALVGSRIRHKSLVTVLLSLLFLGAYFYAYSRLNELLGLILQNLQGFSRLMRSRLWPLYQLGLAATGKGLPLLLYAALTVCLALLLFLILSRSLLTLATTERGRKKEIYRGGRLRSSGLGAALLRKELRRFLSSPVYMLNCGMGILFLLVLAVLLPIKGGTVREALALFTRSVPLLEDLLPLLGTFVTCLICGVGNVTAPSVSLEGKNLWLLQSYPVPPWEVLRAKERLQLCLFLPPALLFALVLCLVLGFGALNTLPVLLTVLLYVWAMADLGLVLNLVRPNLRWTNETVPVKQSMPVLLSMFGGWFLAAACTALGVLFSRALPLLPAMLLAALLPGLLLLGLRRWLRRKGCEILSTL